MKIALISDHASPLAALGGVDSGGQNVYVAEVAAGLARSGHDVDVFTRSDNANVPPLVTTNGYRVIHIKAGENRFIPKEELLQYMPEFSTGIISFMKKESVEYDYVHANFFMSGMAALEIKKELGIPFAITFHALGKVRRIYQGEADKFSDDRFEIEDLLVQKADAIIAECPQDKKDLVDLYRADPQKITIVPCGVDTQKFFPVDRLLSCKILNLDPELRYLTQIGRMVKRKGIDTVIRSVAALESKARSNLMLLIVGGESNDPDPVRTPEIGRLMDLVSTLGINDHVTFVGRRDRDALKYYYSVSEAFITTPWYEPFGITPLEAMACGVPVIASNVGGLKYSVVHGKTGLLVKANDPKATSQAIKKIIGSPFVAQSMRENALKRIHQNFTWDHVAQRLYQVFVSGSTQTKDSKVSWKGSLTQISDAFKTSASLYNRTRKELSDSIVKASESIVSALADGHKLLVCGNGGSAMQAQHLVSELVGSFLVPKREALPAICLNTDVATITAWANDSAFEEIFSRQIESLGSKGDILMVLSTGGNSKNLVKAVRTGLASGLVTIGLLGKDGGKIADYVDQALIVPSFHTPRIQEVHLTILHTFAQLIESAFVKPYRKVRHQKHLESQTSGYKEGRIYAR